MYHLPNRIGIASGQSRLFVTAGEDHYGPVHCSGHRMLLGTRDVPFNPLGDDLQRMADMEPGFRKVRTFDSTKARVPSTRAPRVQYVGGVSESHIRPHHFDHLSESTSIIGQADLVLLKSVKIITDKSFPLL